MPKTNDQRLEQRAQPCEAFIRLCELAAALHIKPLPEHPACWEHQVDERWWICINGHKDGPRKNSDGFDVPPFECVLKYNGWPAGMFGPGGGVIAAGACANENTFIEALVAATKAAEGQSRQEAEQWIANQSR